MLGGFRRARSDQHEMRDMLRIADGISHREDAAPAVPEQVDALDLQMPPERFEVADHPVDGQILGPSRRRRFSGATLVVEDDLAAGGHVLPDGGVRQIAVIEAGPAVDGDKRNLARRPDRNMMEYLPARIRRCRFVRRSKAGRGDAKAKRQDEMARLAGGHGLSLQKIGHSSD